MKARVLLAIIAASAGLGALAALTSLPPGLAAGQPAVLMRLVFGSGWFWRTVAISVAMLALLATLGGRRRNPASKGPAGAWRSVEPVLWGAAAPLLSVALDPWFFHRTAPVLAVAGIGLGTLAALARRRELPAGARPGSSRALPILVALAVLVPTFLVLPGPPWFHPISGDEPHYLVIARSLWIDGNVDVRNEYDQRLLTPFWPVELSTHAKPGADPEARYSIHGSGLGVWLAPWYGAGRDLTETGFNVLIRAAMTLWLAAAAAALFFLLRDVVSATAAVRGTALAVFTLPLLFAGPHLFPAVPVFALSCAAYAIVRRGPGWRGALAAGLLLSCLPWLHFKFFGVMAAVAAAGAWSIWQRRPGPERLRACAALAVPLVATTSGHAIFTWRLYGRLSPLAVHVGADPSLRVPAAGNDLVAYFTDPVGALTTAIGYFMDQREGLLFYAPHYLLALTGFAWLLKRRRQDALALALVFAALVGPYALSQEIGHWGPPARPLTGVLWTLALPMGIALVLPTGHDRHGRARAALRAVLVACGAGATLLLLMQADLLYHDYNIGFSLVLLRYGAPGLSLTGFAPLWLGPEAVRWGVSLAWLAAVAALGIYLWRWGREAANKDDAAVAPSAAAGGRRTGLVAAACFVLLAAAFMLVHHALIPLTDLHEPWRYGAISYWKPQSPPTRAWATEDGLWTGGHDTVQMLVSSRRPLELIVLELTTLAPMRADVQIGRDRQSIRLAPHERAFVRLAPGPGKHWNGEYFYHFNVVARGGISLAALGLDDDTLGLGVFFKIVDVQEAGSR